MITDCNLDLTLNRLASVRILQIKRKKVEVEFHVFGEKPSRLWVQKDDVLRVDLNLKSIEVKANDQVDLVTVT